MPRDELAQPHGGRPATSASSRSCASRRSTPTRRSTSPGRSTRPCAERERLSRRSACAGDAARASSCRTRLPDLPKAADEPKDAEQTAHGQAPRRADGQAHDRRQSRAVARADQGDPLRQRARARLRTTRARPASRAQNGYEIELELPLFDFGSTRVARAEAHLHAGGATAPRRPPSTRAPKCASPTRRYRTAYDLARHYRDEVVPLRKRISEENLLRYNGMLIGVFELLADARDQIAQRHRLRRGAARLLARRDRPADGADRPLAGRRPRPSRRPPPPPAAAQPIEGHDHAKSTETFFAPPAPLPSAPRRSAASARRRCPRR